ncbi:MAG: MASE1 domain-containing protein [Flammeovirgaceae bacterium]|nr:MASE1 domain-containing protein [Flammeovirgaceae bacterium]
MNNKLLLKYTPDFKIVLGAVLYFFSAQLGYFLAFSDSSSLPVWPPSGVAFALIILLGRSSWPGIAIGALISNLMGAWNNETLTPYTLVLITSLITLGQTLEILIGNYLVKIWIKDDYPFNSTKDTFRFLFVVLLMSLAGAGICMYGLFFSIPSGSYLLAIDGFRIWVSHVVGILLFTPFILAAVKKRELGFHSENLLEGSIFVVCMVGIYSLIQLGYFNGTLINSLPFLLIPFLLWLAFRFDLLAGISVALFASLFAIYYTTKNQGPFIQINTNNSILLLQIFIGVISVSTIVLSATVAERSEAQNKLKQFNLNLETMVEERTRELRKRNTELDNFVYSVSHDLRAPIASVLGLLNLARKDKDPAMKDVYLDKITNSALQQDSFIREILDQSRNSRLEVKKDEILFEPLIDETFNQLKFATATGTVVEKVVNVKQDGSFYSDRWRLKVILNNIISNSIRYRNGHDPVINVSVNIADHKAIVEITDNGRGIPKEHISKIYQMFYRATDDGAGSGLGLYIVKETMDKLKGQIKIESEEGRGTIVKLEIPELN